MDPVDYAKEREMLHRQISLEAQLNKPDHSPGEEPFEIEGIRVCLDCLDPIPLGRLEAWPNALRCVDCKAIWEKRNK